MFKYEVAVFCSLKNSKIVIMILRWIIFLLFELKYNRLTQ